MNEIISLYPLVDGAIDLVRVSCSLYFYAKEEKEAVNAAKAAYFVGIDT